MYKFLLFSFFVIPFVRCMDDNVLQEDSGYIIGLPDRLVQENSDFCIKFIEALNVQFDCTDITMKSCDKKRQMKLMGIVLKENDVVIMEKSVKNGVTICTVDDLLQKKVFTKNIFQAVAEMVNTASLEEKEVLRPLFVGLFPQQDVLQDSKKSIGEAGLRSSLNSTNIFTIGQFSVVHSKNGNNVVNNPFKRPLIFILFFALMGLFLKYVKQK